MKVCQIDTCVISDILEDKAAHNSFIKFIVESNSVIGLSPYTFYELLKRNEIYNNFLEAFPPKRIVILKPSEILLKEEINSYSNRTIIEPIFVPPTEDFELIK